MEQKGFIVKMPGRTWSDIWYNLKRSFHYFKKFFWVIWWFRGMDSVYTLEILRVALNEHLISISDQNSSLREIDETRIPKEQVLKRAIELLDHKIADNYNERCGYDHDYKTEFVEIDETDKNGEKLYRWVSHETEEQSINNERALKEASILQKSEWNEFTEILNKHFDGWWC